MLKLSKSEIESYLPESLHSLPIVDVATKIDFNKNFMITTPTASGKTIGIGYLDAILHPDKQIFLRQPNRIAVHSLYSAYKKFFEDRMEVGIMTSMLKENTDAPIVFVSDGILANIFRRKSVLKDIIIIEDEAHSLIGQTEIELALIKQELNRREKEGIEEPFIRVLTATIDPTQISSYLNIKKEDVHIVSKSNFITNKFIIDASKSDFDKVLMSFIKRLVENNRNGIVFVPTRANTESYQIEYEKHIKTEFIHAGESPDKIEQVMKENRDNPEPLLIFSTIAGAMSITVNVDDVLILDEKIDSKMKEGVEHIIRAPCDDNLLIQMCFDGNTNILTPDGYRKIKDINIGSKIISFDKFSNIIVDDVIDKFERNSSDLYEIENSNGDKVITTSEHPFLMKINGSDEFVKVCDINELNKFVTICKFPRNVKNYNMIELLLNVSKEFKINIFTDGYNECFRQLVDDYLCAINYSMGYDVSDSDCINLRKYQRAPYNLINLSSELGLKSTKIMDGYLRQKSIPLSVFLKMCDLTYYTDKFLKDDYITLTCGKKKFSLPIEISDDFMWLVGIIASDGSNSEKKDGTIVIRIFNTDLSIIDKARDILSEYFGYNVLINQGNVTSSGNIVYNLDVKCYLLGKILEFLGLPLREKSKNMFVSEFIKQLSDSLICSFLEGCYDGDGRFSFNNILDNPRSIRLYSISERFIDDVKYLLLTQGISSWKNSENYSYTVIGEDNKRKIFICGITNQNEMVKFMDKIIPIKWENDINYHQRNDFIYFPIYYSGIRKLEKVIGNSVVYNLSVKKNQTYIANGYMVHNCGRTGRFKDGNVYLYTNNHKTWDEIIPRPVELPLEKTTPFDVSMILAQYGVSDIKELELMSKINVSELKYAMDFLKERKVIENCDSTIQLTKLGKVVQKLPLDVKMAIIFANSNPEIMPMFASSFASGYSNVWSFMSNIKTKEGWQKAPINDKYYNGKSEFISKAKIIQDAFIVRSKGRGGLLKWCLSYRFDYRYIGNILNSFSSIENSLQKKLRDNLIDMNIDSMSKEFVNEIIDADVFPIVSFKRAKSGSLVGWNDNVYTILSSETERILYLQDMDYVSVMGNIVQIVSKKGNTIRIMSSGTVIG